MFHVDVGLKAVSEQACFACPSCVYCRGHHLPSVRLHISTGSHHPPHPLPWLPISLQWVFLSATSHSSMSNVTLVFLFSCSQTGFYCRVLKTKAFDTPGLFQNKRDYWEAQLSGFLDPVGAFAACFYAVKLDIALYFLQ